MIVPLDNFIEDSSVGVFLHPEYAGFTYTDGEVVERMVYEAIKSSTDTSCHSVELQQKIIDWATEYHFTPVRHNLLRHIDINQSHKVLELGAGCGAITRQLGETGALVTAIEGSLARAKAASERCRDLANVKIHCSDFNKVKLNPVYDIVTLIGVLEYAPLFTEGPDPILDALRFAKSALKPSGRLIIAIENQIGLKYFAGSTEDHLGERYLGIEDRYLAKSVRTLGRGELTHKIKCAGFFNIEFQYPYPDYKLPSAMIFEEAYNCDNFLPDEIIRHMYARDYSGKGIDNIDTSMVWPVLWRNGLMQDMANSFLIIASEIDGDKNTKGESVLALAYTNDRRQMYNTITEFVRDNGGNISVKKRGLVSTPGVASSNVTQRLGNEPYICARTLHSEILSATKRGDLASTLNMLRSWLGLLTHAATSTNDTLWQATMPDSHVDCTPYNLLKLDGGLHHIDKEWIYKDHFTLGALVLRYITRYADNQSTAKLFGVADKHPAKRIETIRLILLQLGLRPGEGAYQDYALLVNRINSEIFPDKPKYRDELLEKVLSAIDTDSALYLPKAAISGGDGDATGDALSTLFRTTRKLYASHIGWRLK